LHDRSFEIGISALLLATCAAFAAACSSSVDATRSAGGAGNAEAGASSGGSGGSQLNATEISFEPSDEIRLKPKMSHQLTVRATPPGSFRIRFAFSGGDDPADAVLEASEVETDAEGIARVTLIAPSEPATFNVRASTPSALQVAHQSVVVSAFNVTTLRVEPSYSGQRPIAEWTATTRAGVNCGDLPGNPAPDGDRFGRAVPPNPLLEIDNVPVGVDLAVTVRAGHYIGGCLNVPALSEGDGNQVLVYASDRPLNLSATDLSLSLGATPPHLAFDKLLMASADLAESALLGGAKNDVAALLDGMRDATSALNRQAFNVARTQNGWDSALDSAFGKSAARRMRDPAQRWLAAGLLALDTPNALVGQLRALGSGVSLTPRAVAATTPSNAGFPGLFVGTWSAESNDTVLLGMDLDWAPSRLVTALAVAPALLEFPEATSAELALSLSVDCALVSQVLLAYGVGPGSTAFASCDADCAVNLCRNALASAWNQAQLSSGAELATLSVTAAGPAQVGDEAQVTSLSGSWVGELRTAQGTALVSGALSASSGAP